MDIPDFGNEMSLRHECERSFPDHLPNGGSHFEEEDWVQDYMRHGSARSETCFREPRLCMNEFGVTNLNWEWERRNKFTGSWRVNDIRPLLLPPFALWCQCNKWTMKRVGSKRKANLSLSYHWLLASLTSGVRFWTIAQAAIVDWCLGISLQVISQIFVRNIFVRRVTSEPGYKRLS